jgi:F0F1-type ATP synthase membrane subunit c/vacuolar-type H+-ATPase subunit K
VDTFRSYHLLDGMMMGLGVITVAPSTLSILPHGVSAVSETPAHEVKQQTAMIVISIVFIRYYYTG